MRVRFLRLPRSAAAFRLGAVSVLRLLRVRMTLGNPRCRLRIVGASLLIYSRARLRILTGTDLVTNLWFHSSIRLGHKYLLFNDLVKEYPVFSSV